MNIRSNIGIEDREAAQGNLLGKATVVIWNDVEPDGQITFYDWHDKEHIPERLAIEGFLRGRRYVCRGHSPEWLTLYEARDLSVLTSDAYLARLNAPTEATTQSLRHFRRTSRAVCRNEISVGRSNGGHVLALRIDVASAESNAGIARYLKGEVFPRLIARVGILGASALVADGGASFIDTAESKTRSFDVPSFVILVEASEAAAAGAARSAFDSDVIATLGGSIRPDGAVYSLEISRLHAAG